MALTLFSQEKNNDFQNREKKSLKAFMGKGFNAMPVSN